MTNGRKQQLRLEKGVRRRRRRRGKGKGEEQNGIKLQGRAKKHQNVRYEVLAAVVVKIQGFSTRMCHSCCVSQLCHKVQHNADTRDVTIQCSCSRTAACNEAELCQSC